MPPKQALSRLPSRKCTEGAAAEGRHWRVEGPTEEFTVRQCQSTSRVSLEWHGTTTGPLAWPQWQSQSASWVNV